MANTYNNLSTSQVPKDRARRLLGDTGVDGNAWLLTDEEILSDLGTLSFSEAVASLALGLASRFAQYPDEVETAGSSSMKWSERVRTWRALAEQMVQNPTASAPRRTTARLGTLANPKAPGLRK
jgi:hypothetical protein